MTAGEEKSEPITDKEYLKTLGWMFLIGFLAFLFGKGAHSIIL